MKKVLVFFKTICVVFSFLVLMSCGSSHKEISLIPIRSGSTYGYVDREGKMVINPQFASATIFRDGLALVKTSGENGKWGYINEEGKYAIQPTYQQATLFSDGIAFVVSENMAPVAIDTKGDTLFTVLNAEHVSVFHEGLAAFSVASDEGKEKWGFIDKKGEVVIQPQFAAVGFFSEGKCAAGTEASKFGYIDKEGKYIINPQFKTAKIFESGKAIAGTEKEGIIDGDGKYIVNPQFDSITPDDDGYVVTQDEKFGWIDEEGKISINPQFSVAFPFKGSKTTPVMSGSSWGYINREGKFEINPQFDLALPFDGNIAVAVSGKKVGFIDDKGKYTVNPQFDGISDDYITHRSEKTQGIVQTDYFNIGAITDRVKRDINPNAIQGISFRAPMSEIMVKFKKQETDFSEYNREHYLSTDEKVANVATLQLLMTGNPYIQKPGRWYYERVFDRQATANGFIYIIQPTGKGTGKEDQIITALDSQGFPGFTKDTQKSDAQRKVFTSSTATLVLTKRYRDIAIFLSPKVAGATTASYVQ